MVRCGKSYLKKDTHRLLPGPFGWGKRRHIKRVISAGECCFYTAEVGGSNPSRATWSEMKDKEFKIIHEPTANKYYIGWLESEYKGIKNYCVVKNKWTRIREAKCESLDDIITLEKEDTITVIRNYPVFLTFGENY